MNAVYDRRETLAPVRVLIVDDDEPLRAALGDLLREAGFEVVGEAADGSTAVSLATDRKPDVVLMDFRMPGMDGVQALGLIKGAAPFTQAVMLTAYGDEVLDLEAARDGVYCLLVKGCAPGLILTTVRQAGDYKRQLEARAE